MIASVVLLVFAQFMTPCTIRIKRFPWLGELARSTNGHVMQKDPVIHARANIPRPHMIEVAALSDGDHWKANIEAASQPASQPAKLSKPATYLIPSLSLGRRPTPRPSTKPESKPMQIPMQKESKPPRQKASPRLKARQTFPPTGISNIDADLVMDIWAQPYTGTFDKSLQEAIHNDSWPHEAMIMQKMRDDLAEGAQFFADKDSISSIAATSPSEVSREDLARMTRKFLWRRKLEVVGLIPEGLEIPFLESGLPKVHSSVFAFGMFRRDKLEDDSRGSIRKAFEENGKQGTRPWLGRAAKQLDVFSIEGLAGAPGYSEISTAVLLSKIDKYAHKEKMIVEVPKNQYHVMEHYVRLGFKKVEMEDGSTQLIYIGTSHPDAEKWADEWQVMIGIDQVWTGA